MVLINVTKMEYRLLLFGSLFIFSPTIHSLQCHAECPKQDEMACGFDRRGLTYRMFPSECALKAYGICTDIDFQLVPLRFCVRNHFKGARRFYGESCPVFCPNHYRPVCGVSKYRDYAYRSFINGCYLDMINCRGDDDYSGYVEVPLSYCQRHPMRNIFKEQLVMSNMYDTLSYG